MKVLLLDNHDSFTYNIAHMLNEFENVNLQIITSDLIELGKIDEFDAVIFSPGPDIPEKGNIMELILDMYKERKPILGICLGLQAITLYFGGKIQRLEEVVHGRTKNILTTDVKSDIFEGMETGFIAGLYHSWIASEKDMPDQLQITALSEEGRIMALKHKIYKIEAVQFHPESIMTPNGPLMISNWLKSINSDN